MVKYQSFNVRLDLVVSEVTAQQWLEKIASSESETVEFKEAFHDEALETICNIAY